MQGLPLAKASWPQHLRETNAAVDLGRPDRDAQKGNRGIEYDT